MLLAASRYMPASSRALGLPWPSWPAHASASSIETLASARRRSESSGLLLQASLAASMFLAATTRASAASTWVSASRRLGEPVASRPAAVAFHLAERLLMVSERFAPP